MSFVYRYFQSKLRFYLNIFRSSHTILPMILLSVLITSLLTNKEDFYCLLIYVTFGMLLNSIANHNTGEKLAAMQMSHLLEFPLNLYSEPDYCPHSL